MRTSGKTILNKNQTARRGISTDFVKEEFNSSIKEKGYEVIYEKAYICPCKSRGGDALNICSNCGGSGWVFANPTRMKMLITGIRLEDKLKDGSLQQWGQLDIGFCMVTADEDVKLTFMDRIINVDSTAEHQQVIYPVMSTDGQLFAYTSYNIQSIDYIALYEGDGVVLKRLVEPTDYTYQDNIIRFSSAYDDVVSPQITIRYVHNPVYHIIDIMRESMTSYNGNGLQRITLPIHALARRAHLVIDKENYDGDRLLDNSWLPDTCDAPELTKFQRQLRYQDAQYIYDNLSQAQKVAMQALFDDDSI